MPDFFILDINSQGCIARLGVNGAPLALDAAANGQVMTRQINEWIMPSDNALTVFLLWPAHKEYKSGVATVSASVYRNDPASPTPKPAPEGKLAEFLWPARLIPEVYPFPFQKPFVVSAPPPCQLWSQAAEIKELTDQDKSEICGLIDRFRDTLLAGNSQEAYALTQYKFDDLARANGSTPARVKGVAVAQYNLFKRLEGAYAEPFDQRRAVFEIVCGKKIVSVTNGPAGEAITIRQKSQPDAAYAIDIFVSKINGKWLISR